MFFLVNVVWVVLLKLKHSACEMLLVEWHGESDIVHRISVWRYFGLHASLGVASKNPKK